VFYKRNNIGMKHRFSERSTPISHIIYDKCMDLCKDNDMRLCKMDEAKQKRLCYHIDFNA
jgi:hypothetical protein